MGHRKRKKSPDTGPSGSGGARRRMRLPVLIAGLVLVAGLVVVVVVAVFRPPRAKAPTLPAATFEEQADGAKRVLVDSGEMASFCERVGLPAPPPFEELDGVLSRILYEAHSEIAQRPDSAAAYGRLGDLYQAHDRPDHAVGCYQRAIELGDSYEWHYQLFRILSAQGQADRAIEHLHRALALNPNYAPAYFHLGEESREAGDVDTAETAYREYVKRRPNDDNGYVGLALVARMKQDDAEAMRCLRMALERNPDDYRVHFQLARLYREQGNTALYEKHQGLYQSLPRRIKLNDDLATRIRLLGTTLQQIHDTVYDLRLQGRAREALQFSLEAVNYRPRSPEVLQSLAVSYHSVGEPEKALEAIRKSLDHDPDSVSGLYTLCEISLKLERLDDVVTAATRAIQLDPSRAYPYWLRGQAMRRSRRLDEAVEDYREAARRAPDNYLMCLALAGALHESGRLTEARTAYQQALRAKPGDAAIIRRLEDVERLLIAQSTSQPASTPAQGGQ